MEFSVWCLMNCLYVNIVQRWVYTLVPTYFNHVSIDFGSILTWNHFTKYCKCIQFRLDISTWKVCTKSSCNKWEWVYTCLGNMTLENNMILTLSEHQLLLDNSMSMCGNAKWHLWVAMVATEIMDTQEKVFKTYFWMEFKWLGITKWP